MKNLWAAAYVVVLQRKKSREHEPFVWFVRAETRLSCYSTTREAAVVVLRDDFELEHYQRGDCGSAER